MNSFTFHESLQGSWRAKIKLLIDLESTLTGAAYYMDFSFFCSYSSHYKSSYILLKIAFSWLFSLRLSLSLSDSSVLDLLGDDETSGNMERSPMQEAHVAFSVEGMLLVLDLGPRFIFFNSHG